MKTPIYTGLAQSDLDANGYRIFGLHTPTATNDAATKAYVDAHSGSGSGSGLPEGWVSVMDHGAVADGVTDDTAAAIAAVAAATSVVYFPPGNYFFAGSIGVVPANVSLVGANMFGPSGHVATSSVFYVPNNHLSPLAGGTCFMLTAGAGSPSGTPFITLSDNSSVTGITFYWPNQLVTAVTPTGYPWAIKLGTGAASSVRYCNFINAFRGIYIENTIYSLIEEVRGSMLSIGIRMEGNFDVTRLRGVHFNASWNLGTNSGAYQISNSIAFDCGRNDLLIMDNCFCFQYKNWLHFYDDTAHDVPPGGGGGPTTCWAQIRGGGGDSANVHIEKVAAAIGVDIDGAIIKPYAAPAIIIDATNNGAVKISNSTIESEDGTFGTVAGTGNVSVNSCHFLPDLVTGGITPTPFGTTGWAVTGSGNFSLRDCTFRTTQTHVSLGSSLTRAVVTGNLCSDTFNVTNNMAAGSAVIDGNTGQGTVYVGADARLVAISGGVKLEVRNTGTGTWVEATRYTNP